MERLSLSAADVATCLSVSEATVEQWVDIKQAQQQNFIPESELKLLKYSLMSENKYRTLF